jgi:hypothetical protein
VVRIFVLFGSAQSLSVPPTPPPTCHRRLIWPLSTLTRTTRMSLSPGEGCILYPSASAAPIYRTLAIGLIFSHPKRPWYIFLHQPWSLPLRCLAPTHRCPRAPCWRLSYIFASPFQPPPPADPSVRFQRPLGGFTPSFSFARGAGILTHPYPLGDHQPTTGCGLPSAPQPSVSHPIICF